MRNCTIIFGKTFYRVEGRELGSGHSVIRETRHWKVFNSLPCRGTILSWLATNVLQDDCKLRYSAFVKDIKCAYPFHLITNSACRLSTQLLFIHRANSTGRIIGFSTSTQFNTHWVSSFCFMCPGVSRVYFEKQEDLVRM